MQIRDNDDSPGFFSDIRKNFVLIIGGIVSLTTVVAAFLNQTSQIFGWQHISTGYCAFVIIYFIVPYLTFPCLLVSTECGIAGYSGCTTGQRKFKFTAKRLRGVSIHGLKIKHSISGKTIRSIQTIYNRAVMICSFTGADTVVYIGAAVSPR